MPDEALVVGADNKVVWSSKSVRRRVGVARKLALTAEGVDVETRDPLESRVERLDELLSKQVVHPDITLGLLWGPSE